MEFLGPTDETRRELDRPAGWKGVVGGDLPLLVGFVDALEVVPDEFHTHVGCGVADLAGVVGRRDASRRIFSSLWPRRIDCMMRFGDVWWVIEVKVDAAHYVLGQCLCYVYWLSRECPSLDVRRVVVVTNRCDDGVGRVLEACGVDVVELPEVFSSSPG